MLRAVIFDLDDTLIPEASAVRGALSAACAPAEERLGLPPGALAGTIEAVAQARYETLDVRGFGPKFGVTWEELLWGRFGPASQRQLPGLGALAQTLRSTVFADALSAFGVRSPLTPGELEVRFAAERRVRLRPFPEVAPLIGSLKDRALLTAVATNGAAEVQREKLVASNAAEWFDEVVISGEEGVGKPDPGLLVRVCQRLGVSPEEAIYVGNTRDRDVAAARAAGIRSVLVERFEPAPPTREVWPRQKPVEVELPDPDRTVYEVSGLLGFVDGWRSGKAFRVFDPSQVPNAVDEPIQDGERWLTRVGPERDQLRPGVRALSRPGAIESGLRSLRARAGLEPWRHDLGEEVDWDALLR